MIISKGKPIYDAFIDVLERLNDYDKGYWTVSQDGFVEDNLVSFKHDDKGFRVLDRERHNMPEHIDKTFFQAYTSIYGRDDDGKWIFSKKIAA